MFANALRKILLTSIPMVWLASGAFAKDAKTAIQDAERVMGHITSVRYSGTGKLGVVGMNWSTTGPWHPTDLTQYMRTIDYPTASSREDLTRAQEDPPALGGEAPFWDPIVEGRVASGKYAWDQPADSNTPLPPDFARPSPGAVEARNLQIWLTPHGFLKAASANGAVARDVSEDGERFTALTFTMGSHKITGLLNGQNLVTKIETQVPNPVLGDMPVVVTFANYKTFGAMKFPTHILQRQGGSRTFELNVASAKANVAKAALTVPENVLKATVPPQELRSERMAAGVWMIYGGHNSVLVEFEDYLAVVEAPLNEARSLAIIAEVKRLVPNKPIKYVINTHHHFDHSGGLRTFVAQGATVITHEGNREFYQWAWKQPRTMQPDELSKKPTAAQFITFKTKYVLSDGVRDLEVHLDFGDMHDRFLSFAYLPKEKILIEADDFSAWYSTPWSLAMWNNLLGNLARLQLDPVTIAPLHGPISPMDVWLKRLREDTR